jgi:sulfur-carrier protein adenylyltransferase/sulfurtransferase
MFTLQEAPIDLIKARELTRNSANGAMVSFEGIVRNDQHKNSQVSALLYIADTQACITEGEQIIKEALSAFPITEAVCIQRIGQVNVGETAVWIGVWYRDEAFKGCRYIIEEIKKRLLIWKKEFYTDGTSQWIHGKPTEVIL